MLKTIIVVLALFLSSSLAQRYEVTPLGWLGLGTTLVGLAGGGSFYEVGFTAGLSVVGERVDLFLTPKVVLTGLPDVVFMPNGWGLTLGCTSLVGVRSVYHDMLADYESNHCEGWLRHGSDYLLRVFEEPCKYDPMANWAPKCPNQQQIAETAPFITGAFRITLIEDSTNQSQTNLFLDRLFSYFGLPLSFVFWQPEQTNKAYLCSDTACINMSLYPQTPNWR